MAGECGGVVMMLTTNERKTPEVLAAERDDLQKRLTAVVRVMRSYAEYHRDLPARAETHRQRIRELEQLFAEYASARTEVMRWHRRSTFCEALFEMEESYYG